MIKLFIIFCFTLAVTASDRLGVGAYREYEDKTVYTIQLFSDKNIQRAQKLLKRVPVKLREKTDLYRVGGSIKGRYSQSETYSAVKPYLQKFHKAGFRDAFIVKSSSLYMEENLIAEQKQLSKNENQSKKEFSQQDAQKSISVFDKSAILLKAQGAYQKGNESEAMIYYEMLFSSKDASQKIKNNLCYLYGKRGAWLQAKDVIESERYQGKLIYAYAYGAVQNTQESYYNDMLPYITVDRSGRLLLLTGYYFEKKEEMSKAVSFYEMAYEKNPSDVYNIFAYARALDMEQKMQAAALYRDVLSKIDSSHSLYATTQKRVSELGK